MALEGRRDFIEGLGDQEKQNCHERAKKFEEIRINVRTRLEEAREKLASQ